MPPYVPICRAVSKSAHMRLGHSMAIHTRREIPPHPPLQRGEGGDLAALYLMRVCQCCVDRFREQLVTTEFSRSHATHKGLWLKCGDCPPDRPGAWGTMQVESVKDVGTTFIMRLPMAKA